MNISKFVSPEIILGLGAISQVGESAIRLGANKVFLVSDEGVINSGWVEKTLGYLKAVGLRSSPILPAIPRTMKLPKVLLSI